MGTENIHTIQQGDIDVSKKPPYVSLVMLRAVIGVPFGRASVRDGDTLITINCRLDGTTLGFYDGINLGSYGGTKFKPEEGIGLGPDDGIVLSSYDGICWP
eukprot:6606845-Ditylum_brightwellii.AAC.1